MKQIIAAVILSAIVISTCLVPLTAVEAETPQIVTQVEETVTLATEIDIRTIISETILPIEYKKDLSVKECRQEIKNLDNYIISLKQQNKIYIEEEEYELVLNEIARIKDLQKKYKEEIFWGVKYAKYPTATKAWLYMKNELGYSDIVCAGIMGNLMAETGGHTLKLDWDSNGGCGYGLIQWIGGRREKINKIYGKHPTIEQQMRYMHNEFYGLNGVRKQVTDKQLSAIMDAKNPESCAYAFACYFERCAVEYRSLRRGLARQAYEYFVG